MSVKLRIMLRAVNIRMEMGQGLEDILSSYPRLSREEKALLRKKAAKS